MPSTIRDLTELTTVANDDYVLISDTSDVTNRDKRISVTNLQLPLAKKTGTPVAGRVASWADANTLQDGGIMAGDQYLESSVLLVDAAFTTNTAAHRFATIGLAITACTGGETILIAPGIYSENVIIDDDDIKLIGSGAPHFDTTTARLVGGTIIRGRILIQNARPGIQVMHLGVDLVGVNAIDCIGSATSNVNLHRRYSHLTLLGNGNAAAAHGIYLDGHYNNVDNVRVYNCYHGMAVHGSFNNISNMTFTSCNSTSLIVKAKSGINCYQVNINNIVMLGDPASTSVRAGPLAIQSEDGVEVRRVNVSNVSARYCNLGVVNLSRNDGTGTISECSFTNIVSDSSANGGSSSDYWVRSGNNIIFNNCRSTVRSAGFAFHADPVDNVGDVYVYASYCDGSYPTWSSGIFKVNQLNGGYTGSSTTIVGGYRGNILSMATDTVWDITPIFIQGMIMVSPLSGVSQNLRSFLGAYRASTTPVMASLASGADVVTSTAILTGTTETAGKLTVSAASNGHIYVSNRLAATVSIQVLMFG